MYKLIYAYKIERPVRCYIYLPIRDNFAELPEEIKKNLSANNFIMIIPTSKPKLHKIAMDSIVDTIANNGYYLYVIPPEINLLEEFKKNLDNEKN